MPVIRRCNAPEFEVPNVAVRGLASPKRGATETCVWQIALAPGAPGFPHVVTREEVFVATAGMAVATIGGETLSLEVGDTLVVPAGVEFALANPSAEPFEAFVAFPVGGKAVTAEGNFTPPWAE
jgi:quercetin dioxygenase-like cupin family protein